MLRLNPIRLSIEMHTPASLLQEHFALISCCGLAVSGVAPRVPAEQKMTSFLLLPLSSRSQGTISYSGEAQQVSFGGSPTLLPSQHRTTAVCADGGRNL